MRLPRPKRNGRERKSQQEREWAEREKALAAGEQELAELRGRAAGFAEELKAATERAAAEAVERAQQQHQGAQELLRRELEGEKNVLATKIAALERTVQEQAEQLSRLEQQAEKAYAQVQEIAVRAIEGSASTKQLANLQQLFAEQVRKSSSPSDDRGESEGRLRNRRQRRAKGGGRSGRLPAVREEGEKFFLAGAGKHGRQTGKHVAEVHPTDRGRAACRRPAG